MQEKSEDILFSEIPGKNGNLGQILLNRPKALNALTNDMCFKIREQLIAWEKSNAIKAVIIRGAGDRAFCAGGDIRAIYQLDKNDLTPAEKFFKTEYRMNATIFHCKKAYISLLDGITMGGGAGISVHGSHRVATERLMFAMPETGIGFFPDIGAGYFLSRCKNKMGYYLGLTGDRIGASDARSLGLVNHVVSSQNLNELVDTLAKEAFTARDRQHVSSVINSFAVKTDPPRLSNYAQSIDDCFSAGSVEEIVVRLEEQNNEWSLSTIKTLLSKSPTSLKVTFKQLHQAEAMDFDDIMRMEYNIALQFLRSPDFFEGVRAAVIDKDQNPHWKPNKLDEVTPEMVNAYFSKKQDLNSI